MKIVRKVLLLTIGFCYTFSLCAFCEKWQYFLSVGLLLFRRALFEPILILYRAPPDFDQIHEEPYFSEFRFTVTYSLYWYICNPHPTPPTPATTWIIIVKCHVLMGQLCRVVAVIIVQRDLTASGMQMLSLEINWCRCEVDTNFL